MLLLYIVGMKLDRTILRCSCFADGLLLINSCVYIGVYIVGEFFVFLVV